MELSIELLIDMRDAVGVSKDNPYLFPKCYSEYPYDGTKILRDIRAKIKLKDPSSMTSRGLRTNLATMSAVCNFDTQKKAKIAQSLGHDMSTHERYYALPQKEVQRGVVGEVLLAAARGNLIATSSKNRGESSQSKHDNMSAPLSADVKTSIPSNESDSEIRVADEHNPESNSVSDRIKNQNLHTSSGQKGRILSDSEDSRNEEISDGL
ncbi:unnamed protein product [Bemisia tabaci]|uniref:Uncharacterized protein n=1 Tax=Bemisia tabaci TaxID=7038 RepID=A0A9P0AJF8_BEMTA|nr:unnamed protein product [Bemisia tabaci]